MRNENESPLYVITILGEPASKANSRQVVLIKGRYAFIKSKKALLYLKNFKLQCRQRTPMFDTDLVVGMTIWYKTRRPDLDESLILDAMQGIVYVNDRQVKLKVIAHELDKENPRSEIVVAPLELTGDVIKHVLYRHD